MTEELFMIFDMHIHQNRHSSDSKMDIYEGIEYAKTVGLDGICITDHDDLGLRPLAEQLSKETGIQIIVGVEIYTLDGDLLCYGIDKMPETRMSAQETIDYVHAQGGACIAAHPYRHNRRGLEDTLFEVEGLSAVEGYNGRTKMEDNLRAVQVAKTLSIPVTGGSDAHTVEEVGNYVTVFEAPVETEEAFIQQLKAGRFYPSTMQSSDSEEIA